MSTPPDPTRGATSRAALLGLAAAMSALAVWQWYELFQVAAGATPICSLGETVDCARVWSSEFAKRVRSGTGLPVAGLGLAWGLTALALAGWLRMKVARKADTATATAAVRLWGAAGALSCILFAVASYRLGALCLTCLGTYVLVLAYAAVAAWGLPDPAEASMARWQPAAGSALVAFAPIFLLLLFPAAQTPHEGKAGMLPRPSDDPAAAFAKLSPQDAQAAAIGLAVWRSSPQVAASEYPPRRVLGTPGAPVHVVDFTDILCPHCAALVEELEELERALPPGRLSVEARQFPLDGECNKVVKSRHPDGIRCAAAKAIICLEQAPDFAELRRKLFAAQPTLQSKEQVLSIAASGSVNRAALDACIASPETQAKVDQDVDYAMRFKPEGTPIVLANGRVTIPSVWFLYGLAAASGNPDAPWLRALPPPQPFR